MESVLPQNGMRFAAKWKVFWPKMERVLAQNGARFGPKWNVFWPKMQYDNPPDALIVRTCAIKGKVPFPTIYDQ